METMGDLLATLIASIDDDHVTLRHILHSLGNSGSLILCAILCIPFLIPVSVPGVSTVFGSAIILLSIGVLLDRSPWLPARIHDRRLDGEKLKSALSRGHAIMAKLEVVVRPRLHRLCAGSVAHRVNALAILAGGVLLIFPLGLVPFSNTLPALAILFVALGMAQRDGLAIIGGYCLLAGTALYFAALGYAVYAGLRIL
jgi:hypothetical protein